MNLIPWIISLHIIFVVTWFSGLFYLPRLFVYHTLSEDIISQERFKIMERKLYYGIATPSMILTILLGHWIIVLEPSVLKMGWIYTKLFLVATLVLYHLYCGYLVKIFKENRNKRSHVFYRWFNEYPVVVLVGAVILAVVKPF
jgi:putative membrane protein